MINLKELWDDNMNNDPGGGKKLDLESDRLLGRIFAELFESRRKCGTLHASYVMASTPVTPRFWRPRQFLRHSIITAAWPQYPHKPPKHLKTLTLDSLIPNNHGLPPLARRTPVYPQTPMHQKSHRQAQETLDDPLLPQETGAIVWWRVHDSQRHQGLPRCRGGVAEVQRGPAPVALPRGMRGPHRGCSSALVPAW